MSREVSSISRFGLTEPFELQVGRNQIGLHYLVNVQGYNEAHAITFRAPWELSNTNDFPYPASSVPMTFTSTVPETMTVLVSGLDANYVQKQATVQFTASTNGVVTSGDANFFRINALQIIKGSETGNMTASNGGTVYAQITNGNGRSQAAAYTVPAGFTFLLTRAQAFTTNNGTQFCTYRVWSRSFVDGVSTPTIVLYAPFTQAYFSTRVVPRAYAEKTDIQWQLRQSNAAPGSVQVEGILISNG